jgi:hypothetical protein
MARKAELLLKLEVLFWGVFGIFVAIAPAVLFFPSPLATFPLPILISVVWAALAGWPVTSAWSKALHKRVAPLKSKVDFERGLEHSAQESDAERVDWIPGWLGFFERVLYSLLIGLDVGGGAAFIGVWIGIKLAGGWQSWSKGTTYGRATLGVGLLGNAMSVLFGVVAGLVMRVYLHP